eukprot:CAMPEP_0178997420 /NCGR_PEP_ID=MMETSP0795-20121207/8917_1 /TAXON_ID=88552 /ORGANISM="Amoebophrya sp., Strain Ameob2" /LENGTH=147 /DNA_ID=CAMNT_0020689925 /DNA_START=171 /DNA_END=614 /DNA_ORIENTATION=+
MMNESQKMLIPWKQNNSNPYSWEGFFRDHVVEVFEGDFQSLRVARAFHDLRDFLHRESLPQLPAHPRHVLHRDRILALDVEELEDFRDLLLARAAPLFPHQVEKLLEIQRRRAVPVKLLQHGEHSFVARLVPQTLHRVPQLLQVDLP